MSLPDSFEEWRRESRGWRRRARMLLGDAEFTQPRARPRDPDEAAALEELGLDGWRPFVRLQDEEHPAKLIRRARTSAGLTQAALGERLGMSQQQVQRLEDPRHSNPTWETVSAVAAALGHRVRLSFQESRE